MCKKQKASSVVKILKLLSNEARLMMLCKLCEVKEVSASELNEVACVSQPAGSQHLATLKEAGIIDFRREHNVLYYHLSDKNVKKLIDSIYKLYCN